MIMQGYRTVGSRKELQNKASKFGSCFIVIDLECLLLSFIRVVSGWYQGGSRVVLGLYQGGIRVVSGW